MERKLTQKDPTIPNSVGGSNEEIPLYAVKFKLHDPMPPWPWMAKNNGGCVPFFQDPVPSGVLSILGDARNYPESHDVRPVSSGFY